MPAVTKNLTIEQKATFRKKMTYRDKFKKPINLTGYGARLQIRAADGSLIREITDGLIGSGKKPIVLLNDSLRERAASEGVPVIVQNGRLRCLDSSTESLMI